MTRLHYYQSLEDIPLACSLCPLAEVEYSHSSSIQTIFIIPVVSK